MMRTKLDLSTWACVPLAFAAMGWVPAVEAQTGFRAWVNLSDSQQISWLENENRINSGELCGESSDFSECYSLMMRPYVSVYDLFAAPDDSSRVVGELILVAVPGRGLSAHFRAAGSEASVSFVPDLFLQDWGYGPFFHQSFSQEEDGWFQLPTDPWEEPAWLRVEEENPGSLILSVSKGDIIEIDGRGMYVISADAGSLTLRAEQPGDFWCEGGTPPPIIPSETVQLPRSELIDSRGHLRFRLKYLKGC